MIFWPFCAFIWFKNIEKSLLQMTSGFLQLESTIEKTLAQAYLLKSMPICLPKIDRSFPLYLLVFTPSTAVIKGLLRNLLRSILSSSAVNVLGLPEPWRLSIVPFHFVSISEEWTKLYF
jgi:hypothetical protein